MPATLRKKSKAKSQAGIYEHIESIEQPATKEFVRQELAPVRESVNRLWQVMLGGFALMLAVMGLLLYVIFHLDNKADKRFDKIEAEQKEQRELLLQILQKR